MIHQPTTPRAVQAAVIAARSRGLPIAIQAGGDRRDALAIDMSRMRSVAVDPERRVARVGAGATWAQVIEAAARHGLAPLSGPPTVGVTGFTLGGGASWLSRKHGFAADSVLRAELVTAAGRRITAAPDRHADLFWALRGGGGGFGVVTELEFRLHPVERVYAGTAYFPPERAADTLAVYRDWVETAPDELSTAIVLTRDAFALKLMHVGAAAEAERLIEPLRAAAGPPIVGGFRSAPYGAVAMCPTKPLHLDLLRRLPDAVLDFLVEAVADDGLGIPTIELRHRGGAMARPAAGAGAVGHRDALFSMSATSTAPALAETLRPHAGDAYPPGDRRRLAEVRATYDPPRRMLALDALHGDRDVHARRPTRVRARGRARPDAATGARVRRQLDRPGQPEPLLSVDGD